MCRSHTPPSYHLLTPFNYSHVLFYFLPDHDDILGSKSSEGISDFIDALDASNDSNPERFSGWRIGSLGVRFNGQKRPLCFFPFFLFFFTKGARWGTEGFHWRGWSPYLFTVARRTCAYTRQSGITSHGCIVELWLASRQKQPVQRARIHAETFIQLRSFGGDEKERENKKKKKKKGNRRPRLA